MNFDSKKIFNVNVTLAVEVRNMLEHNHFSKLKV